MTAEKPATKQTAANNKFLADVKDAMNAAIFREASATLNFSGEASAREYLSRFFRAGTDLDVTLAEMAARTRQIRAEKLS